MPSATKEANPVDDKVRFVHILEVADFESSLFNNVEDPISPFPETVVSVVGAWQR
jgi:hypothetical protein